LTTVVHATWSKKSYFSHFSINVRVSYIDGKIGKVCFFAPGCLNNSAQGWSYFLRKLDIFFEKFQKNAKNGKKNIFSHSNAFLPP